MGAAGSLPYLIPHTGCDPASKSVTKPRWVSTEVAACYMTAASGQANTVKAARLKDNLLPHNVTISHLHDSPLQSARVPWTPPMLHCMRPG